MNAGQHVVAAVPGRAVPVLPAAVAREQFVQCHQQILVAAGAGLEDRHARRRVRDEDRQQAVRLVPDELGAVAGEVVNAG